MKFITYNQYIKYFENTKCFQLNEKGNNYNLELKKDGKYDKKRVINIDKWHDKLVKNILNDKKEMANFINQFLNIKIKIKCDNLVQCSTDFITKNYKNRYSDIVYKLKNKPIYFLIEHQSTVDKNMIERIGEYVEEIMRKGRIFDLNEESFYPVVVPIVIYTGYQKWNSKTKLSQKQYRLPEYKKYRINLEYNLIEIHNYTFEELLEKKTLFSNIMIIEKCKTKEEIEEQMDKIIKNIQSNEDKEKFSEIIKYIVLPIVGKQKAKEMLERLFRKDEVGMSPFTKMCLDMEIKGMEEGEIKGERKGIKKGIKKGVLRIAKKMIEKNMEIQEIQELTGLSKQELDKLIAINQN